MDDLLYGINPISEALKSSGRKPLNLFVQKGQNNPRLSQLVDLARSQRIKVAQIPVSDLERMVGHSHHQGIALKLTPFQYHDLESVLSAWKQSSERAFFLVLDGITDPHNFGAILRSAEIAGCGAVIVAKDRSCPVTPVVEKTAAGALAYLPLCRVTNLARSIELLKQSGVWCYGLAGEDSAADLFEADLKGDLALVVGSEGKGLRPNIRNHCDGLLAIPMVGRVGSLNASVAAGIALFEVLRNSRSQ